VWLPALLLVLVVVASSAAMYVHWTQNFRFLDTPDAMRYAAVAREVVRGNGYAWRQYLPYELGVDGYSAGKTLPQFLHPLVMSLLFGAFGVSSEVVSLSSMIPTVVAVALLFVLAWRLFDVRVAFVSATLFALSEQTLDYSISGLTEPLFTVLFLICLLLVVAAESSRLRLVLLAAAGAVLGLSHAARPVGFYYVAAFVVYLLLRRRHRVAGAGIFVVGFAVLLVLTAYIGTGSLLPVGDPVYGLLTGVGDFPNVYDWIRSLNPPDPWSYILGHPQYFIAKVAASLRYYASEILQVLAGGSLVLGALFLISLFTKEHKAEVSGVRLLLLLLVAAQLAVNVLLWRTDRYFVPFLPLVIAFAVAFLFRLVDSMARPAADRPQPESLT
jgi:4-amino-4-deoxy-L-arabinose transferase-like glycosyltransferase